MATGVPSKPSFSPRRRWSIGLNVLLIICVVLSVVVMVNYLSRDYFWRFHWGSRGRADLSPLTVKFLQSMTNQVRVTIYYKKTEPLYTTIAALLNEYRLVNPRITIQTVDYLRDPGAAQKVKEDYKLVSVNDQNLVIFDCEGRSKPVNGNSLAKYVLEQVAGEKDPEFHRRPTEFLGEKIFTSALLEVTNPKQLNAYFVKGHGEHAVEGDNPIDGYRKFAELLKQQHNIHVQPLSLRGTNAIPLDCHLLVIAGARTAFFESELEKVEQYLAQGGRLLALFTGNTSKETGLEQILVKWGVEVGTNVIKDLDMDSTYQDVALAVSDFSSHQIVNPLIQSSILLYRPRSIARAKNQPQAADAPTVEEIARTGPRAYALAEPGERRSFPLIVAVEKGRIPGVIRERGSTRIVVVGDSTFLANGPIDTAGNSDFAGFAVNWLLDRAQLLDALGPQPVTVYRLVMTRAQMQQAQWILLAGMPGASLLVGGLVWLRRRR